MAKQSKAEHARLAKMAERVKRATDELVASLYNTNDRDTKLRYENLKTFRVEVIRSFILYTHLAIEDLLTALLFDFFVRQNPSMKKKEAIRIVEDMRSMELIQWCGRLRLITPKQHARLLDLNRIRNACAHHWVLDIPKYKRRVEKNIKRRVRVPVVSYNNRNLLRTDVFSNDFCPTYGGIYLKLLWKVWKIQGKL